jgi:hydroxyacylglutathione hydrolase
LQRLGALPAATQVWCAHEYTEGNLRWASAVAPNDGPIADRLDQVLQQRAAGHSTVPTSIGLEKGTNLFLRASTAAELAALRGHKDGWSG